MKNSIKSRILAVVLTVVMLTLNTSFGAFAYKMPETGYTMSSSYMSSKYYSQLCAVQLTGYQRIDIVEIAKSQIGYHEGSKGDFSGNSSSSSNYAEYNRYAYSSDNAAWCGSFISWCAAMAGIPTSVLPKTAGAKPVYWKMVGASALKGATAQTPEDLVINGGKYIPEVGELVFFGSKSTGNAEKNSCSHVGLIIDVNLTYENGKVTRIEVITAEGNYSDKVKQNTYVFDASHRDGHAYRSTYLNTFCSPNYRVGNVEEYASVDIGAYGGTLLRSGSSGTAVRTLQFGLNLVSVLGEQGLSEVSVNGNFDDKTLSTVKKFHSASGLSTDGVVGKDTWSALRAEIVQLTKGLAGDLVIKGGKLYAYKGTGKSVKLPESVKQIGADAFRYGQTLAEISLPLSLTKIENGAFSGCTKLEKVNYSGTAAEFAKILVEDGNGALTSQTVCCQKVNVQFIAGEITFDSVVGFGSVPAVSEDLVLTKKGNAYYSYEFAGWRMNGVLYKELPKVEYDCVFTAEFVMTERLLNVDTLNDLLIVLSKGADDIDEYDFVQDGVLNVDDLNCLLVLLATAE